MSEISPADSDAPLPAAIEAVWHALPVDEAVRRLEVDPQRGLEENDATWRLARHGPNRLREKPPRPLLATFVGQFKSLLILILFGAAVIAWTIGAWRDAIVIMIVTLLNALLGFSQEYRAERSLGALKQMLAVHARVRRQGEAQEIPANELVPGDIVLLEAGDRVPADGRLLTAESMEIDESSLTGESQPVSKRAGEVLNGDTPVSERSNMAFMNTMVNRGRGELAVTGTGMRTEIGRVAEALSASEEPPTPLQIQLDRLGKRLSIVAGGFVAAILGLSLLSGRHWGEALMEAIALAVATVPEGLPAVATVTLAIGMQRMARNRAIVKRLAAVEALGCTTVIGADKTGTLTLNQMTARAFTFGGRRYTVTGEGYRVNGAIRIDRGGAPAEGAEPDAEPGELSALLLPLALCNDSALHDGRVLGDPMEGALLVLAEKGGVDRERAAEATPRIAEVPFDAGHKFMATFHRDGDVVRLYVKGAPEAIMARSAHVLNADGERPLDDTGRGRLDEENAHLAERQMRVLAVASREIPSEGFVPEGDLWRYLEGLTLLGLVGLLDPPRPEVKAAIERCQQAGIEVKMITGDQGETAVAIARELGLGERVMTGAELDGLDPARAADEIARTGVFARVTPVHKLTIVEALQSRGEIVAMTGDGVNDAPALKKAHIGVAMGRSGTEVAKEAATTVLIDDNFATIVDAVEEGRSIYSNIVKFVRFQLSTNIGALLSMFVASLLGWPAPLNTIQILWVNIIMDGPPAMAMGLDPARPEIMRERPRATDAEILSWPRFATLLVFGGIMVAGTLGILQLGLHSGSHERALTLAFTTFVLFQVFNAFNARVERGSALTRHLFTNPVLWGALAGVTVLQAVAVEWPPAQAIFRTISLSAADWLLCTAVASSVLIYGELHRWTARHIRKRFPAKFNESSAGRC